MVVAFRVFYSLFDLFFDVVLGVSRGVRFIFSITLGNELGELWKVLGVTIMSYGGRSG